MAPREQQQHRRPAPESGPAGHGSVAPERSPAARTSWSAVGHRVRAPGPGSSALPQGSEHHSGEEYRAGRLLTATHVGRIKRPPRQHEQDRQRQQRTDDRRSLDCDRAPSPRPAQPGRPPRGHRNAEHVGIGQRVAQRAPATRRPTGPASRHCESRQRTRAVPAGRARCPLLRTWTRQRADSSSRRGRVTLPTASAATRLAPAAAARARIAVGLLSAMSGTAGRHRASRCARHVVATDRLVLGIEQVLDAGRAMSTSGEDSCGHLLRTSV